MIRIEPATDVLGPGGHYVYGLCPHCPDERVFVGLPADAPREEIAAHAEHRLRVGGHHCGPSAAVKRDRRPSTAELDPQSVSEQSGMEW